MLRAHTRRSSLPLTCAVRSRMFQVAKLMKLLSFIGAINGGKTPSQVALNYLVARGALPIPGCKTASQVQEHAGATGWRLDDNEVETIAEKLDYLKL